jgi:hypothetical protein
MPATGSKKIDTVAAELVPRKRRAASVSNSLRRILRKFRNTTLGGVRRGGAWALGVNPSEHGASAWRRGQLALGGPDR